MNESNFLRALADEDAAGRHTVRSVVTPLAKLGRDSRNPLRLIAAAVGFVLDEARHVAAVRRAVREFHPEIHVIRVGPMPWGTAIIARLTRSHPIALKTFSLMPRSTFDRLGPFGAVAYRLDRSLQRRLVRQAIAVDSVTPQIAQHVRDLWPEANAAVVDNGVDTTRYLDGEASAREDLGIPEGVPVVAYVGGHPLVRGGREVLRAVAACRSNGIPMWGLIVGCDAAEIKALEREASAENVGPMVRILPTCAPEDVPRYMQTTSVGLALDDPERVAFYGSSSQKIRQYLSAGAAVISFDGTNGFVLEAQLGRLVASREEVPAVVQDLVLSDGYLSGALAARARKFAIDNLDERARLRERFQLWEGSLRLRQRDS